MFELHFLHNTRPLDLAYYTSQKEKAQPLLTLANTCQNPPIRHQKPRTINFLILIVASQTCADSSACPWAQTRFN